MIKWWEQDTGKLMLNCREHSGWVTDFRYWSEAKVLLSSGNDGQIVVWGSGGNVVERITVYIYLFLQEVTVKENK